MFLLIISIVPFNNMYVVFVTFEDINEIAIACDF